MINRISSKLGSFKGQRLTMRIGYERHTTFLILTTYVCMDTIIDPDGDKRNTGIRLMNLKNRNKNCYNLITWMKLPTNTLNLDY